MSKNKTLPYEKELRSYCKSNGLDVDSTLQKWEKFLEENPYDEIEDEKERLAEQSKEFQLELESERAGTARMFKVTILSIDNARTWNEDKISDILLTYEETGNIPVDDNDRPLLSEKKKPNGEIELKPLAYSKAGNAYPLEVRRSQNYIMYGAPLDEPDEKLLFQASLDGQITYKGEEMYVVDTIDHQFYRGKTVHMPIKVGDYINISTKRFKEERMWKVVDDDPDLDEIFDEIEEDRVDVENLDRYIRDNMYTPLWLEARVVSIGDKGNYGNYPIYLMDEPKPGFGENEVFLVSVPEEIPVNFAKRDIIRVVGMGYVSTKNDESRLNAGGIFPLEPRDNGIVSSGNSEYQESKKAKEAEKDDLDSDFLE